MSTEHEKQAIAWALTASSQEVGPACMHVPVPATIDDTEDFREAYCQGYRHALSDVRAALPAGLAPPDAGGMR